jgi:hypothetical protein
MKLLPCSIALAASILCASGASAVTLGPYSGSWDASDQCFQGAHVRLKAECSTDPNSTAR